MSLLDGYRLEAAVESGRGYSVARGRRLRDSRPVLLKRFDASNATPTDRARFRGEYEAIASWDLDGIPRVLELEVAEREAAVVIEDPGGRSLDRVLAAGEIGLEPGLDLAIGLSGILGELHRRRFIHGGLRPDRLSLRPDGRVAVTGLGIESALARDAELRPDPARAGPWPRYLSPEQTGRMSVAADYRSDLYSLGVLLYEVFTGEVPFGSDDPLETIHAHIARSPRPLGERRASVPRVLSDIVLRLLAKAAEERYQNCYALRSDLEECRKRLRDSGGIEDFRIGLGDCSLELRPLQATIGREEQRKALAEALEGARQGKGRPVLVRGPSGIGKTALLRDLQLLAASSGCGFLYGKFEQFAEGVPYAGFMDAFRGLVPRIESSGPERLASTKAGLVEAIGPNGGVLADFVPGLQALVGPWADPPALDSDNAFIRLEYTFGRFLDALSRDEPLALCLDDFQWADAASADLVAAIASGLGRERALLVLSFRDDAISGRAAEGVERARRSGDAADIAVPPLSKGEAAEIAARLLGSRPEGIESLGRVLAEKTGGNPLGVFRLMRSLADEGLLSATREAADGRETFAWRWDAEKVRAVASSEAVAEAVAKEMSTLPPEEARLLGAAATIGSAFDAAILSSVLGSTVDETVAALGPSLREGRVMYSEGSFRFAHDRIREAALALVPGSEAASVHLRIGEAMQAAAGGSIPDELAARIADHLDRAEVEPIDAARRLSYAELNLRAGRRANSSAAFEAAYRYFEAGIRFLPVDAWAVSYELCLALHDEAIEAAHLCGDAGGAERFSSSVLANARSRADRIGLYRAAIVASAREHPRKAIEAWLEIERAFGLRFPSNPGKPHIALEYAKFKAASRGLDLEAHIARIRGRELELVGAFDLMPLVGIPLVMTNPLLFAYGVLKILNLCLKLDIVHEQMPFLLLAYSILLCGPLGDIDEGFRVGTIALRRTGRDGIAPAGAEEIMTYDSFVAHWKEHLAESLPRYLEAHRVGMMNGEYSFAAHSLSLFCLHGLLVGRDIREIRENAREFRPTLAALRQRDALGHLAIADLAIGWLIDGPPDRGGAEEGAAGDVESIFEEKADEYALFLVRLYRGMARYCYRDFEGAALELGAARDRIGSAMGMVYLPILHYYDSLVRLARFPAVAGGERGAMLRSVRASLRKLRGWAELGPMNLRHKADLVDAELARRRGEPLVAEALYEAAAAGARDSGYVNDEAVACERAAEFFEARRLFESAGAYRARSARLYRAWGAEAKARAVLAEGRPIAAEPARGDAEAPAGAGRSGGILEYSTVLKASRALSGEIELGRLLQRLLEIAMENAGARRGAIALERGGELLVEAEGSVDGGISVLRSVPLPRAVGLPASLAYFALRSGESVVLDEAANDLRFGAEPCFRQRGSRSVLCAPIKEQGRAVGVLYLENELVAGAFTPDRLELLSVLSAQAAISIRNAILYAESLEGRRREQEVMRREMALKDTELRSRRLELELLKKTIQPHFLMNTLTAIRGWLLERPKTALRLIDALGEELRPLVSHSDVKLLPIEEEIGLCRSHLVVMGLRLEREFSLETEGIRGGEFIPPLVFHTMLENSFSHCGPEELSKFRIEKSELGDRTRYDFTVHCSRAPAGAVAEGTGTRYIKARLEESFPGRWSLEQGPRGGGWRTTIEIRGTDR